MAYALRTGRLEAVLQGRAAGFHCSLLPCELGFVSFCIARHSESEKHQRPAAGRCGATARALGKGGGRKGQGGLRARAHTLPLPLPLPLPLLLCSLPLPLCSLSLSRPLPLHITCLQAVAAVCLAVADASEVSLTTWEVSGVRSGTAQIPPLPASTLAVCLASPDTAQSKS